MKNSLFCFVLITGCSFSSFAIEKHKVGVGINYHLEQKNSPSYQFSYQWQFSESFELESRYSDSGDLEIVENDKDIFGDYSQFSLGANFIKRYNEKLSIKAGTGLGFMVSSSNDELIQKQAMAPYIMFAASYQLNKQMAFEFGQFSHFNSDVLDTHHSIYLSFQYQFSQRLFQQSSGTIQERPQVVKSIDNSQQEAPKKIEKETNSSTSISTQNDSVVQKNTTKVASIDSWYVQFGAFNNNSNATQSLTQLLNSKTDLKLKVLKIRGYYRVVSEPFTTKQRAEDFANMLNSHYSLSGYVTQLKSE